MSNCVQAPHALLIPFPFQGHVTPFVHLAIKLATKGFIITFINTQSIHHQISQANSAAHGGDIFGGARESGLDIRYATFSDGFPLEFDRKLHEEQYKESILNNFHGHVDKVVGEIVSGAKPPVSCLVADTFYVWPSVVAKKYGLVNVSFWTEPALVLSLYYHLDILRKNGHFGMKDNRKDTIDYIPGVRAIDPTDLMSFLQDTDIWTVIHRIIYKAFDDVKRADIIVCNTVQELELETISALHQKQPTYAIGPIFPIGFTKSTVPTSLLSESDCTHWLNTRPKGSVLYVSFGSLAHPSQHDIVEIAHGLLLSGVGFVWVLRPDLVSSDDSDFLPVGFEENVKYRGVILPWCSQIDVISHPAIGGFLTHCGWNSILESVWCGIPLLCAPLMTDQFTNRKLVVDDWKVGLNLCDNTPITREEVTNKINYLMCEKTSNELRKEIRKVRKTLEDALATNGSSERNFNQFIEDVRVKVNK